MQINPKIIQLLSSLRSESHKYLLPNSYLLSSKPFAASEIWVKVALEGSREILGTKKILQNGNDKKCSRMVHHEVVCKSIQGKF